MQRDWSKCSEEMDIADNILDDTLALDDDKWHYSRALKVILIARNNFFCIILMKIPRTMLLTKMLLGRSLMTQKWETSYYYDTLDDTFAYDDNKWHIENLWSWFGQSRFTSELLWNYSKCTKSVWEPYEGFQESCELVFMRMWLFRDGVLDK